MLTSVREWVYPSSIMETRTSTQPLPPLDLDGIRHRAHAWVDGLLVGITDAEALVAATSKIINDQAEPAERLRARREVLALSVREYGPDAEKPIPRKTRNVRLAEAVGISRPRLQTLRNALPGGVTPELVPNSRTELPRVARLAATYDARIEHARVLRDTAMKQLMDEGWRNIEISRLTGFDASRAAHLRAKWFKDTKPTPALAS